MPPQTRGQALREESSNGLMSLHTAAGPKHDNITQQPPTNTKRASRNTTLEPPRFTIDLSLPPEQRYAEICDAFRDDMLGLTSLFEEVVGGIVRFIPIGLLRFCCRLLLRRVYNEEENAELRGISKATGVKMYLLVCFNVLLDLFMGCSSGGAQIGEDGGGSRTRMVHFRTLDWGMPSLRKVIVQLDYKRGPDQPVFASSITYAGFVGVLTGARKNLSMSLNFRPTHDDSQRLSANLRYYGHHLMVLLGMRPSISSTLRTFLLRPQRSPRETSNGDEYQQDILYTYEKVVSQIDGSRARDVDVLKNLTTTACYLCFCNGKETTVVEKDRVAARTRVSEDFIVVTNADFNETASDITKRAAAVAAEGGETSYATALLELTEEALERKACAERNWKWMRVTPSKPRGTISGSGVRPCMKDVVELVQKYPTTNECTHFACVMDPGNSERWIAWCRKWRKSIGKRWIDDHQSL